MLDAARVLGVAVESLRFSLPVAYAYNPLIYAWEAHAAYLRQFAQGPKRILFLGMNPGPFGMVQTGVPFGEVRTVRDWLGIQAPIGRPAQEHPLRPVTGFACPRSEVSGRRLWGLFAERFGEPEAFFAAHFVANYCPLAFLETSGANRTPDKLPRPEKTALFGACDKHLRRVMAALDPEWVIGVGEFAAAQARRCASASGPRVGQVLHPSPANPAANQGWAAAATRQLQALGAWD